MFLEYKEVQMQQNLQMSSVFINFLSKEKFDNIIEIGTRYGAFTRFLKDTSPKSNILTYDILDQKPSILDISGLEIRIKNIFSENFESIIDDEVLDILKSNTKKLILCDGGNKIKEFNCFSQYLQIGDIIMAHDYSKTVEYFDVNIYNKIWDWCEITENDVIQCSEKYGLVHYNQEQFQKAVWLCKIKVA